MKTLNDIKWDKIEVNEVFAFSAIRVIGAKIDKDSYMDMDCSDHSIEPGRIYKFSNVKYFSFQKLPLSVQRLYRQDF